MLYKINNLNLIYKDRDTNKDKYVLKDINLELPNTGFYSLVGESGSGKSSLLYVLSSLRPYTNGSLIYNKTVTKFTDTIRYTDMAFILQSYLMVGYLTVKENILISIPYTKNLNTQFDEIVKTLGITHLISRYPHELSGGQKQRVAIARALIRNPKVIFADEPTSALDPENKEVVTKILQDISKNILVIMVTHDVAMLEYCDYIITLESGQIVSIKNQTNTTLVGPALK